MALSFYAGLRACEIAALRVGDVFDEAGGVKDTIYLNSDQTKGSDSGTVLVNSKLKRQLMKFAKQYPVHVSNRSAPLLFSAKGGGFTAQTIVNLFKRIYQLAGIDGASSHSGRRQFVTQLADRISWSWCCYHVFCFTYLGLCTGQKLGTKIGTWSAVDLALESGISGRKQ